MPRAKEITVRQAEALLELLKSRFEAHRHRHAGIDWASVQARVAPMSATLWSLNELEQSGGEPDVVGLDVTTGEYIFMDCSAQSPRGRRSLCDDGEALAARKEPSPITPLGDSGAHSEPSRTSALAADTGACEHLGPSRPSPDAGSQEVSAVTHGEDQDRMSTSDGSGLRGEISRRSLLGVLGGGAFLSGSGDWRTHVGAPQPPSRHASLHYEPLSAVARLIETGAVSPVEVTQQILGRIRAMDGDLHSYVTVTADRALSSAKAAEAEIRSGRYRGPLHGIPIGVKDLCFTQGVRTMGGTTVLSDFVPTFDATAVARLRAAGAVIVGKLTLCEGAMGPYHPQLAVPVNPWNATRWSGVSSSGSGVATAAGLCFGSIGTDTGGSIRYPSAANGCVGLKPTYGRVSRHGVLALAESLDHVGPMARTVEDAAIMFDAMAGYDPNDPTSLSESVRPVRPELERGIRGLRVGFDRQYSSNGVEPQVLTALEAVLQQLSKLGAEIVDVRMPDVAPVAAAWWELATAEAAAFHAKTYPSRSGEYGAGFRAVLEYGASVRGVTYANAAKVRAEFTGRLNRMLSSVDLMVCPSMSNAAQPKLSDPFAPETDESWASLVLSDIHTKPFNFSGSPTLSVPCGVSADGLPLSVQFVGPSLSESVICRAGYAYEHATRWHTLHP